MTKNFHGGNTVENVTFPKDMLEKWNEVYKSIPQEDISRIAETEKHIEISKYLHREFNEIFKMYYELPEIYDYEYNTKNLLIFIVNRNNVNENTLEKLCIDINKIFITLKTIYKSNRKNNLNIFFKYFCSKMNITKKNDKVNLLNMLNFYSELNSKTDVEPNEAMKKIVETEKILDYVNKVKLVLNLSDNDRVMNNEIKTSGSTYDQFIYCSNIKNLIPLIIHEFIHYLKIDTDEEVHNIISSYITVPDNEYKFKNNEVLPEILSTLYNILYTNSTSENADIDELLKIEIDYSFYLTTLVNDWFYEYRQEEKLLNFFHFEYNQPVYLKEYIILRAIYFYDIATKEKKMNLLDLKPMESLNVTKIVKLDINQNNNDDINKKIYDIDSKKFYEFIAAVKNKTNILLNEKKSPSVSNVYFRYQGKNKIFTYKNIYSPIEMSIAKEITLLKLKEYDEKYFAIEFNGDKYDRVKIEIDNNNRLLYISNFYVNDLKQNIIDMEEFYERYDKTKKYIDKISGKSLMTFILDKLKNNKKYNEWTVMLSDESDISYCYILTTGKSYYENFGFINESWSRKHQALYNIWCKIKNNKVTKISEIAKIYAEVLNNKTISIESMDNGSAENKIDALNELSSELPENKCFYEKTKVFYKGLHQLLINIGIILLSKNLIENNEFNNSLFSNIIDLSGKEYVLALKDYNKMI